MDPQGDLSAARVTPLVVSMLVLMLFLYLFVTSAATRYTSHQWRSGLDFFFLLALCTAFSAYHAVDDLRRYVRKAPAETPAFTLKRMKQMEAAAALPSSMERHRAMRPLLYRGYARLALFLGIARCNGVDGTKHR